MNRKIVEVAGTHGVMSVYEYTMCQGDSFPVIVTESVGDVFFEAMKKLKLKKSICLTMEDLMRGRDVFGVVLIHVRARSECVYGDDVLKDIALDHVQVRTSLEAHLRHFLIDLREQILADVAFGAVQQRLQVIMDRVWCGLAWYLNGKQLLCHTQLEEFVSDIDHDWEMNILEIRKTIHEGGEVSLIGVHDALLGLLHKIDTMEENGIK